MKIFGAVTSPYDIVNQKYLAENTSTRNNSQDYVLDDRTMYPGKYSYLLVCTTAGTTAATLPAWPTSSIISGTTTLTDGTVVWTIYDLKYATIVVDNTTVQYNTSNQLEVKNGGLSLVKMVKQATTDEGKVYTIGSDGTTELAFPKQYKRVSTFESLTGDANTYYFLDTNCIVGTISYSKGNYVWDSTNGFTLVADVGSGSDVASTFVGNVTNGGSFPTTRPDGTSLVIGDFVKPATDSTFPFTIDTVTFNTVRDTAVFMSTDNWMLNASAYQKTTETPVANVGTESVNGTSSTAVYQADINVENASAIKTRVLRTDIELRENNAVYKVNDRAAYPGKYSFMLKCTTAGTSNTSLPTWPSTVVSGTTVITDGTVVWTIYDLSEGGTSVVVEDNLTSTSTVNALSANQGRILNTSKQRNPVYAALSGTVIDLSLADVFAKTISSNTAFSVTNVPTTAIFVLKLINGGAATVTFPTGTTWSSGESPTLQSSGTDILTFLTVDSGTTWVGFKSALDVK